MQKILIIGILLLFVLSCKNNNNKTPDRPGAVTDTTSTHDTLRHSGSDVSSTRKSFPASKDISMVEEKMTNKVMLNDIDYGIIGKFLIQNKDESLSEGVGYSLFEYFNKNAPANEGYSFFLNKKDSVYKEKILGKLIGIMCIDLGEDKYTYDRLVSDFIFFKGSKAAEVALKTCVDNYVD